MSVQDAFLAHGARCKGHMSHSVPSDMPPYHILLYVCPTCGDRLAVWIHFEGKGSVEWDYHRKDAHEYFTEKR